MSEKGKSMLAYLFSWIGGIIVLFACKDNDKKTNFHAAQAIVIGGLYTAINLIYAIFPLRIPGFSSILSILYLVCIIFGMIKAWNDDDPAIPIISDITKVFFESKLDEKQK